MIPDLTWTTITLIGVIVLAGSFVQASLGLGLGMLGAPLIAIIEPQLVPTMILILAVPISGAVMLAELGHVNWRTVGWALPSRIPGTLLGVWLVTAFSHRVLGVVIALVVLAGVALALRAVDIRQTPATLAAAGFVAGTAGTAAAIGGPPMAIVMSGRPPEEARATMSVFFVVGSLMSVVWFAVQGALPAVSVQMAVLYLPLLVVAYAVGAWARPRLPREVFRRGVLGLCAVSALVLLVRSLV